MLHPLISITNTQPDRSTSIGKMIDSYLQSSLPMDDHAIHLLFSANRWEKAAWIEETLAAGYNIICDRYTFSGAVYSAAKHNPTLSLQWAQSPDIGLPCPDLVVFLDLDPEEAKKRGGFGEERYEKIEMQKRVRELFRDVGERVREGMVTVDAGRSVEAVSEDIWKRLEMVIEHVAHGRQGKEVPKVAPWRGFET